jgi:hypothetical protein
MSAPPSTCTLPTRATVRAPGGVPELVGGAWASTCACDGVVKRRSRKSEATNSEILDFMGPYLANLLVVQMRLGHPGEVKDRLQMKKQFLNFAA